MRKEKNTIKQKRKRKKNEKSNFYNHYILFKFFVKIEKRNGYFCYDGDTCNARLLGVPKTIQQIKVRINGIDTPEIKGKCEKEKLLAIEAKEFVNDLIKNSTVIYVKNLKWGKYGGRVVGDLYIDNINYKDFLKGKDFYTEYYGGKKVKDWCE